MFQAHCIFFGVSDPRQKLWSAVSQCHAQVDTDAQPLFTDDDLDHAETCVYCEAVITIFKILTGLLEGMKPQIPAVIYNKSLWKLRRGEFDINFFKGYKMRSQVTRRTWNGLKQEATDSDAFVLFDFPMKFMLKQYRGTTTGWFARVS